jgi:HPt (histidine-containing phosphotransfer) domain-containing protein
MTDPVEAAFHELQRGYLASMPTRLEELRSDAAALEAGNHEAATSLKARLHRLAGSGGSFGFLDLSAIAREAEQYLATNDGSRPANGLDPILSRLEQAIQRADAQLADSIAGKPATVVPRALLVMRPSPQRDRVAQELGNAGYRVRIGNRQDDPAATPVEELPHLLVIGGEAGDGDPSAVASAWTSDSSRRPGAVVLVETLRGVDRLRAIAAGVDAVFPAEHVEQKLPRYARTFARIGPPPSNVLLVDHDPVLASRVMPSL